MARSTIHGSIPKETGAVNPLSATPLTLVGIRAALTNITVKQVQVVKNDLVKSQQKQRARLFFVTLRPLSTFVAVSSPKQQQQQPHLIDQSDQMLPTQILVPSQANIMHVVQFLCLNDISKLQSDLWWVYTLKSSKPFELLLFSLCYPGPHAGTVA